MHYVSDFVYSFSIKYEDDEDVNSLVKDLMPLLNTPKKIQLLTDIRYSYFTIRMCTSVVFTNTEQTIASGL